MVIQVETLDGENFVIMRDEDQMVVSREDLELLVDEANIMLMITQERNIEPFADAP